MEKCKTSRLFEPVTSGTEDGIAMATRGRGEYEAPRSDLADRTLNKLEGLTIHDGGEGVFAQTRQARRHVHQNGNCVMGVSLGWGHAQQIGCRMEGMPNGC